MSMETFRAEMARLTADIAGLPLDPALTARLNAVCPPGSPRFETIADLCRTGIRDGWLCGREAGGIRFSRPVKPGPETHGFSVDVVEMQPVAGPHHAHPNGEIDMIMPLEPDATFDQQPEGWFVYGPGSAHHPTVAGGRAIVLYLLPDGAIEFTRG